MRHPGNLLDLVEFDRPATSNIEKITKTVEISLDRWIDLITLYEGNHAALCSATNRTAHLQGSTSFRGSLQGDNKEEIEKRCDVQNASSYRDCKRGKWRELGIVFVNPLFENSNIILREFGLLDLLRSMHQTKHGNELAGMRRSCNSSTKIKQTALDLIMMIYLWF